MYITFVDYLKKYHSLLYKDYLEMPDANRNFYFTEYKRFVYDGEIKLTIHHYGR